MWRSRYPTLMLALLLSGGAAAQDLDLRVDESTFDEFADAIQPIQITGRFRFATTIDLGIFGKHTITWCDSAYAGTVDGLEFDINSVRIRAQGDAAFTWCNIGFGGPGKELSATGDVTYNSGNSTLNFTFSSATVQPSFSAFGFTIWLPVSINIAPTFNIPPLRIGSTSISFATAQGTRYLRVRPLNVAAVKRNGYIQLTSSLVMQ